MRGAFHASIHAYAHAHAHARPRFVRFESSERYRNFHEVEQLLHTPTDLRMQLDYKLRCPRQLACLQRLLRAHARTRVHSRKVVSLKIPRCASSAEVLLEAPRLKFVEQNEQM